MKVWITSLLFGIGVIEAEAYEVNGDCVRVHHSERGYVYFWEKGYDWHETREAAVVRAEQMRDEKITSLKKQIAEVEALRFT